MVVVSGSLTACGELPDDDAASAEAGTTSLATLFERVREEGGLPPAAEEAGRATLLQGPEHCDAEQSLWLLLPLDRPVDERSPVGYVRDPDGSAPGFTAQGADGFAPSVVLPDDARSTGITFRNAELWQSPTDRETSGYLVNTEDRSDVERWPALAGLCA